MARVVISSDDELPDIDALLKGFKRASKSTGSGPGDSTQKSGQPSTAKRASRDPDERDTASKSKKSDTKNEEDKKRPRKRVLNHRNDNPLLKPLSRASGDVQKTPKSPARRDPKSTNSQKNKDGRDAKPRGPINILGSEEEEEESHENSTRNSEEPVSGISRIGKFKPRSFLLSNKTKNDEFLGMECDVHGQQRTVTVEGEDKLMAITRVSTEVRDHHTSKKIPKVQLDGKRAVGSLQAARERTSNITRPKPGRGLNSTFRKLNSDEDSLLESDGMSNFIVSDNTILEDGDLAITIPPPKSARRLVKGRRPSRVEEEEREEGMGNQKPTDTYKSLGILHPGTNLGYHTSSDGEEFPEPPNIVRKPRRVIVSNTAQHHEKALDLDLDLEELSLGDSMPPHSQPTKTCREQKLATPPGSPVLKPIKLKSPTKKFLPIPKSPDRPSMDSFWNPEVVNEWNDQYSPQKPLGAFKLDGKHTNGGTLLFSPKKSPIKQDRTARDVKKAFSEKKHALAESFLVELDEVLTQGQLSKLSASTGGIKIIWSKKLNTTAGRANWKRETMRCPSTQETTGFIHRHHASIELAEKVIDDEERLLNVIAHEFCHLANFMISNIKTNPHGKEFKEWAAKCSRNFGGRGIEVTTKHSYEIDYKYVWECESCGMEFKRHSKSIDPVKHQCGSCKSKLVQTKPVPRGNPAVGTKKVSEYQTFVKENMSRVREENPDSPQKDMLGLVAKRYQDFKATKLKAVKLDGPELEKRASSKGVIVGDTDMVKSLERKLNFLDLTSP